MPDNPNKVLTVTELTRRVKSLLEGQFPSLWVEGEISNLGIAPSGHAYFTLKDANAQLSAVLFRGSANKLTFKLADGLQVLAFGEISVYERRGQYQIIVSQLMPKGLGALQLAFEQLKQKLAAEGLFETSRKKPIPVLPQRIGVVTSPTGAAIRDFLNIIGRRFPNIHIVINPVRVQGDGSAQEIAAAIDQFNAMKKSGQLSVDVLVITRGGGSLEDLWAFNEEVVARAIARSGIPIISAVGHEIDFTIADFAADLRAPTPSAAAELVVKAKGEYLTQLRQYQQRLNKDLRLGLGTARQRFTELAGSYVFRQPAELIRQYQQQVDDLGHRLKQATDNTFETQRSKLMTASHKLKLLTPQTVVHSLRQRLDGQADRLDAELGRHRQENRHRLGTLSSKLDLLSPKSTLARGYSITTDLLTGRVVRSVSAVRPGINVSTKLLDGEFQSVVSSAPPIKRNEIEQEK
jgi:exodeoxyribonuclease VII large subunit